ncbi:uncharacterized protein H6S33_011872 [Morchella sextelata]|uniref:uncharacterized protein n=1 Tax=Morchella sextelata TaxID=1174677 RepID=UPI001D05B53A|nr:uncharacterized protein H6S33_011872 [Morchella sextelata]KAH0610345.1 hypothetical protein H6S33_011872 [Morchella sextelata]
MRKANTERKTPKKGDTAKKAPPSSGKQQRTLLSFFTPKADSSSPKKEAQSSIGNDVEMTIEEDVTPMAISPTKGPSPSGEETTTRKRKVAFDYQPSSPTAKVAAWKLDSDKELSDQEEEEEEKPPVRNTKRARRAIKDDYEEDNFVVDDDESDLDLPQPRGLKKRQQPSAEPTPKKLASTSKFAFRPTNGNSTPAKPFPQPNTPKNPNNPTTSKKEGKEVRYEWLVDVRDADRNKPGDPEYDPRTLFIPDYAWAKFSPFEKQYWEIKRNLYDTVVFFMKGKFFELFEDDATIGHQEFDLKMTERVNMTMVGVPVTSFDMWASQFIAKGYKVARIDQKETALGKEMREKGSKPGKEEKIIKRELGCILTGGTLVDESMLQDDMATYCAAIKESVEDGKPCFGICFVDTSTGEFSMSEFSDDLELTKFETLIAQIRPRELILEKGLISTPALTILKSNTPLTTIWNKLKPNQEFLEAEAAIREVMSKNYFPNESDDETDKWPEALRDSKDKELVMSAFGALLCYLQKLHIDQELISIGNFRWYDPIRKATSLVLDGQTLLNLEIFANSYDGGSQGTLFSLLNRCITPFGKRMFKQWLCHPLADADKINARLDAVDALNADTGFRDAFVSQLSKINDLERLISRIHAGTCKAIDFLRVLEGFEQIRDAMEDIQAHGEGEGLIGKLISSMPDLKECLQPWEAAFDREKVRSAGVLVPERGVELDFDESQDTVEGIIGELHAVLKEYSVKLKCKELKFADIGKEIYLVEVPSKHWKSVPKNWDQMSATQKIKRFYFPETRKLVRSLREAQETHAQIVEGVAARFFARFDVDYSKWLSAVKVIAHLDCLISLARSSADLGDLSCRPIFVDTKRSVLDFEELRHPTMVSSVTDFIPNDIQLGGENPNITLLTGANAAGKSTVLRMTCVGVIMAQIGCYVPCKSARLTPVDRIMSRLGANDNIFAAQSTFFVELAETKKILSEATPRSLVILDELGRGTSSYDGVAVAQAVLHHVATHMGCIGYFATHYHSLASEFSHHPEIEARRMQIHVDEENRNITFLYKLEKGVAEGSFGMHCAAMCGINKRIIDRAEEAARTFEHTSRLKDSLDSARAGTYIPLGLQSDLAWILRGNDVGDDAMKSIVQAIKCL